MSDNPHGYCHRTRLPFIFRLSSGIQTFCNKKKQLSFFRHTNPNAFSRTRNFLRVFNRHRSFNYCFTIAPHAFTSQIFFSYRLIRLLFYNYTLASREFGAFNAWLNNESAILQRVVHTVFGVHETSTYDIGRSWFDYLITIIFIGSTRTFSPNPIACERGWGEGWKYLTLFRITHPLSPRIHCRFFHAGPQPTSRISSE